jgi:hypothetical protein
MGAALMAAKFKLIFGSFLKSIHQLWLQFTGAFLLIFGVAFGFHAMKEARGDNVLAVVAAASLSLVTLVFGIHSFWKARKLRQ